MKKVLIILLSLFIFTTSCSQIRQSAGVNRKNIDEFRVIENPPLVIPPDFNLLPPEQLLEKNIDNVESDLAKEILFGLNEVDKNNNVDLSTMEDILIQSNANLIDDSIRNQINEEFASEKNTKSDTWKNDSEILDSVAESERLRNQLLDNNLDLQEQVPIIKIKNKKKKKFFFF